MEHHVEEHQTDEDVDEQRLVPIIRPLRLLLDAIRPKTAAGLMFSNRSGGALALNIIADPILKPMLEANGMQWKAGRWRSTEGYVFEKWSRRTDLNR